MPIKVVVSGTGKMGRQVLAAVSAEPELEPVGVLSHIAGEEYLSLPDGSGLVPFGADPAALFTRTRPDVVVDFTNAEYTPIVAREALEAGARLVTAPPDSRKRSCTSWTGSAGSESSAPSPRLTSPW